MNVFEEVILAFEYPGGLEIIRTGEAVVVDGFASDPASTTVHLEPVVVHPFSGKDQYLYPEWERTDEMLKLFSLERLRTSDDPSGAQADRFYYDGKLFEVKRDEPWLINNEDCGYYLSLARKVPVQGSEGGFN